MYMELFKEYEKFRRKVSHWPYFNLDIYSLVHFSYGVLAYKLKLDIYTAIIIAILWEIIEKYYFDYVDKKFKMYPPIQDTLIHAVSDILYMVLGFYFTQYVVNNL
jgi:galactitol-specific phosphotransferase system IIC component